MSFFTEEAVFNLGRVTLLESNASLGSVALLSFIESNASLGLES